MIIASIDIGTNAVLLTVADWDGKDAKVLKDEARITRLGQGLNVSPHFLPEAMERTLAVLRDYRKIADGLGAEKILAVGTAGFRKSKNAADFVADIRKETGIEVRVIAGAEEARLSYLSAAHDFGDSENLLVLDIGGGSTEVISRAGSVSMDLGAVVLCESVVKHDPATEEEFSAMETRIRNGIGKNLGFARHADTRFIGLAGSVTTLSAIKQNLAAWDGSKVQGSVLTMEDVNGFIARFRPLSNAEKSKIVGMVKGREDTILPGTMILKAVMEAAGVDRITVSDRGLRFGLIYEHSS